MRFIPGTPPVSRQRSFAPKQPVRAASLAPSDSERGYVRRCCERSLRTIHEPRESLYGRAKSPAPTISSAEATADAMGGLVACPIPRADVGVGSSPHSQHHSGLIPAKP